MPEDLDVEIAGAIAEAGDAPAPPTRSRREKLVELAFEAWVATDPFSNPEAPPGPSFMPEYGCRASDIRID